MNVFVLSRDHEERARYHCDIHVNKMLMESAQLLNTALHKNGADNSHVFYQPTHKNHPWTKWAARRYANWEWLFDHTTALAEEFLRRSDSDSHKTIDKIESVWVDRFDGPADREGWLGRYFDEDGDRTRFPQCFDDQYKIADDPVQAYRDYYVAEKVPQDWCTWSVEVPEWVLDRQ